MQVNFLWYFEDYLFVFVDTRSMDPVLNRDEFENEMKRIVIQLLIEMLE